MERIWWERVPNALAFSNDIISSLIREQSILIHSIDSLPWRDSFVSFVKENVRQQNSSKTFELISQVLNPGSYLFQKFCKPDKRALYRPSKSYACFLAEHDDIVLHARYLWVELSSYEELETWLRFVSEYIANRNSQKEPAVFILEWKGNNHPSRKKGLSMYSFNDYIGEYDRMVFAMMASSSIADNVFKKTYLAELVSNIVGNHIELYTKCISRYMDFLHDPYCTYLDCIQTDSYTPKTKEDVEHAIWIAQIRTIYPYIEAFRKSFIQKYWKDIQRQLPLASPNGDIYSSPQEVELGTLMYMAGSGKLYLTKADYDILKEYKEARNTLAHLGILSFPEIENLRIK